MWLVRRIHSLGERRTHTEDCGQGLGVTLIVPAPLFTGKRLDEPQTEDARRSIQPAYHRVTAKLQHFLLGRGSIAQAQNKMNRC